ncbi:energy-coupling factor transporter ATPase [Fusibacter sp. JL216-2]|uniref:energy-coupling factor transporter ATPase n=1 Tax=Fusibacter sp. JL216-2 TaxID=3071453 RepID=UPI003D33A5D3
MSILVEKLNHIYDIGSPYETAALKDVSVQIEAGEFIGLIGHTGSGKSTLIQHLNGLLKPTSGKIVVNGLDLTSKGIKLNAIRKKVGLVFQYPEYQLFEETVEKDVAFGPMNLGLSESEISSRVKEAIELVGLDYEAIKDKSPFELSGGQKRRVAIAGVLSMNPEVLILDEPTAGLDPRGRDEILGQIKKLHVDKEITVILVSHSMEDIAKMADRLIVMDKGQVALDGKPQEVFIHADKLESIGLGVPQITKLTSALRDRGYNIAGDIITVEEAKKALLTLIKGDHNA